ncbi:MAG: CvpA family protein [Planctomycetota bacterium]|nr:CvpA family protein [Planctomycetota bacterium]
MLVVDIVVAVLMGAGFLIGILRGFLLQVTGLVGLLGGILLAGAYYEPVRDRIIQPLQISTEHSGAIAFVMVVLLTVLGVALLSALLRKIVDQLQIGMLDRVLGGLFGAFKAGVVCCALLLGVLFLWPSNGSVVKAMWTSKAAPVLWNAMDAGMRVVPLPEGVRTQAREFLEENRPPSLSEKSSFLSE